MDVGKFPGTMSPKLNDVYWHDAPWGGRKTNNYTNSFLHELGIVEEPGLVNDIRETVNPGVRIWERSGFGAAPAELIPPTPWTSGGVTPSGVAVPKRAPPKGKTKGLLGEIAGDEP